MKSGNNQFNAAWTEEEIQNMKNIFPCLFPEEIRAFFPNRTVKAVREKFKTMSILKRPRKVFFPKSYNNDEDGGYVSGIIDGEGSFIIVKDRRFSHRINYSPVFTINLRRDDKSIIQWIRNYFDCGNVFDSTPKDRINPISSLYISDLYSLIAKVIPHFDKYCLRAKKKNDYEIWKKAVEVQASCYRSTWKEKTREEMKHLYESLKEVRKYKDL